MKVLSAGIISVITVTLIWAIEENRGMEFAVSAISINPVFKIKKNTAYQFLGKPEILA